MAEHAVFSLSTAVRFSVAWNKPDQMMNTSDLALDI